MADWQMVDGFAKRGTLVERYSVHGAPWDALVEARKPAAVYQRENHVGLMDMEFRVLGPVVALREELSVPLKPQSHQLLAVLLLEPGHRASHTTVTRYLWPGEEPKANRIRQCFHQLKKAIPEIAHRNERGFCQIRIDPQKVDYGRFREFLRTAEAAGSASTRLAALRSALREVRGVPLQGLPDEGFGWKRGELVDELRDATASCVLTELECGETQAARERVALAMDRWPECEKLLALHVRALRTLGREDQIALALARWEYRTGHSATHLLLAGSPEIGSLRRDVTGLSSAPRRSKPRQLPRLSVELVGRQSEGEQIERAVLGRTQGCSRLVAIGGMPGVGKTVLAVKSAERVARHFPDGIYYADLRGHSAGGPENHERVLVRILNDLGVHPATPTTDGMVSAYRTALADRALLLVLDNVRDEAHVRPLLPSPGASAAIITSRCQLYGLAIREAAELIDLPPLNRKESAELLRTRLGEESAQLALPCIQDLVEYCAGLPLALGIMAARIRGRLPVAIADIVRELRQESTRLRSLDLGEESQSVKLSIEGSLGQLPPPAVRLFWQLAVHPGPTVSWKALRSLEPDNRVGINNAIDILTRMNLVFEPVPERYSLHDLIRVCADELASRQTEAERDEVLERLLRFLLHNAWACDRVLDPDRRLPIGEWQDVEVVAPAGPTEAMTWFETEYSTITAAVGAARRRGLDRYVWLLSMALVTFQWRTHRYLDALALLTGALEAAERVADPADVAMVHRMLAGTHRGLHDLAQAVRELRRAVRVSEDHGDAFGAALARHVLGVLLRESGAQVEAREHFTMALTTFEELGDSLGRGAVLSGMGNVHYDTGRYDEGLGCCLQSLAVLADTGDINGQAYTLFSLGRIRSAKEEYAAAVADFERARSLYSELAYRSREARTLVWLADALNGADRPGEASETLRQARFVLEQLGEDDLDAAVERERRRP